MYVAGLCRPGASIRCKTRCPPSGQFFDMMKQYSNSNRSDAVHLRVRQKIVGHISYVLYKVCDLRQGSRTGSSPSGPQ